MNLQVKNKLTSSQIKSFNKDIIKIWFWKVVVLRQQRQVEGSAVAVTK